jgi:Fur family ferric uptake transcriptional regulator
MASKRSIPSPPADEWLERAEIALQRAGHRASAPRAAVLEAIARQQCVLSAADIADELRASKRRVGVATVYRTLELLEGLKLVQRLDMSGASARFEPALPDGEHHHHHLVCHECGRVTPFEDDSLERAIHRLGDKLDHEVDHHDVILRGSCPECSRSRRGKSQSRR